MIKKKKRENNQNQLLTLYKSQIQLLHKLLQLLRKLKNQLLRNQQQRKKLRNQLIRSQLLNQPLPQQLLQPPVKYKPKLIPKANQKTRRLQQPLLRKPTRNKNLLPLKLMVPNHLNLKTQEKRPTAKKSQTPNPSPSPKMRPRSDLFVDYFGLSLVEIQH